MNIKDLDDINVPKNLNDYINKGIEKGIIYDEKLKIKKKNKLMPIAIASTIALITASNIPSSANELVKIPVVGQVVRILDFRGSVEHGGILTDGNRMVIDSLDHNTINIYFSKDNQLIEYTPNYEIEYREYPYTMVFTFSGVRGIDGTNVVEKVKEIPLVKDVYNLMILDDSSIKIAVEFSEKVYLEVVELKNPAMIQVKMKKSKQNVTEKIGYYITSKEYDYGEELSISEESLINFAGVEVQKKSNGKFVIQFGPFDSMYEADDKLKDLNSSLVNDYEFYLEERKLGEGPMIKN